MSWPRSWPFAGFLRLLDASGIASTLSPPSTPTSIPWAVGVAKMIVTAVVGGILIGCSTVSAPRAHLVAPDAVPQAEPSVRYRIGFLPLVVDEGFKIAHDETNRPGARSWAAIPSDELRIRFVEEIVEAARKLNLFDDVRFLRGVDADSPAQLERAVASAWDDGLDMVARPVLRTHHSEYARQTDAYVPALIMWLCTTPIATWWIADEEFSSQTVVDIEFFSTATRHGDPFAARTFAGTVRHALDDFDQGFNLFNIFITPSGLSAGHWEDIGAKLLPLSRQECQLEIIAQSANRETGLAATLAPHREALEKTVAVVCGTTPAATAGGAVPRFAGDDAMALQRALSAGHGGQPWVAEWAIRPLDGARATKVAFVEAIDGFFGRHVRPGDRPMVFVNLRGAIDATGTPYLLFADSTVPTAAQTGLGLAELGEKLARLPAPVMVVAAVSWDVSPQWRGSAAEPDAVRNVWRHLTSVAANVAVLSATSTDRPMLEIEQIRGSLFVAELLRVLSQAEAMDADRDGWLSWREIYTPLRRTIEAYSAREGLLQIPVLTGAAEAAEAPVFRLPPRSAARSAAGESTGIWPRPE